MFPFELAEKNDQLQNLALNVLRQGTIEQKEKEKEINESKQGKFQTPT